MNGSIIRIGLLAILAIAAVVFYAMTFVVQQTQSALVLRFGAVRSVVTEPGLYFKLPAPFEQVTLLDNRILDLDLPAQEIIASDQKRLVVDAFTRYRISDPLRFYQAVNNIPRANSQLASIVNGNVRSVLAEASFTAMVRTDRSRLMNRIRDDVNREAARFGMTVVDVRLRRVDLPAANSQAVFQRMQTERQREAAEARALGGQQAQEIRARAERESTVIVAEAQRMGGVAAYIDAEHALDPTYAARIGVDIDEILISQPDTGEQALEIADMLIRSGAIDVIVVDSVAALVPRAELEGEMGDATVGLQARLMSQAMRKLAGSLNKSNTTCIFINQLREKVGVMFGNPETTSGGRALKFYASVRIDVRRVDSIKQGSEIVGNRVRAKVVKNKVAPPFQQAEFDIMYGQGISKEGSLLDLGVEEGVVAKSGAWYTYGDERLGQGREAAKDFLREHTEIRDRIEHELRDKLGLPDPARRDTQEE